MKRFTLLISWLILAVFFLVGCGETVNGMIKDTRRIGSGVKKVFVRDG